MNYWWVSQNQTYKQEIGGGYMWSPKANKNGNSLQSYTNMTEISAGDIVFAFYQRKVQQIGIVLEQAVTSSKPAEFGSSGDYWSISGWMVAVSWTALPNPIAPKEHIEVLRPLLPEKHLPIRSDGAGNQAYLFAIGDSLAEKLLSLSGLDHDKINFSLSGAF